MKTKARIIVVISSCLVIWISWSLGLVILAFTIVVGMNAYCANAYHVKRAIRHSKEVSNLDYA